MKKNKYKVLFFDVFGTVVDWRKSLIKLGNTIDKNIDWSKVVDMWREAYVPSMNRVRSGAVPWKILDELHEESLEQILYDLDIKNLNAIKKNLLVNGWHNLDPWPDSSEGLLKLKSNFVISTLSNGNISLLLDMAKNCNLPWDLIISAENFKSYKPDRTVYLQACKLVNRTPRECTLVAAHKSDLRAASDCGLKTIYINRPFEFGKKNVIDETDNFKADFTVDNLFAIEDLDF